MHAGVIKFEPKTTEMNIHQKLQINGREQTNTSIYIETRKTDEKRLNVMIWMIDVTLHYKRKGEQIEWKTG